MVGSCNHHFRNFLIAIASVTLVLSGEIARAEPSAEQARLLKIEGVVRDSAGAPIAAASVRLEKSVGSMSQETTTDVAGHFVIASPSAGTYQLRIQREGFRENAQTVILPAGEARPLVGLLTGAGSKP